MKTTDPVQEARDALDAALRAETDAQAALDQFKTRILSGDPDVSAKQYADAGQAVEFARLQVDAATQAMRAMERDARLNRLDQQIKAEIIKQAGTPDDMLAKWRELIETLEWVIGHCHARRRNVGRWQVELAREGVPVTTSDAPPDPEHAGLGWAKAGMGLSDSVLVDGRRIGFINHEAIIGAAVRQAAINAGINDYQDVFDNPPLRQDPERWFRRNY